MENKAVNRYLRRSFGIVGLGLVIYYGIVNAAVTLAVLPEAFLLFCQSQLRGIPVPEWAINRMLYENAWGYFAAAFTGLGILLSWKGGTHWRQVIWKRGKRMRVGRFFAVMAVFLGMQAYSSLLTMVMDNLFRRMNVDMISAYTEMEELSQDSVSMFLYAGLLAPVWEELLFRGYIQSQMRQFGRTFAIVVPAFLFGMFHGNLVQMPFAMGVGLVLGYVAEEYSLGWCMLLHGFNNLVLADLLPRVTAYLPLEMDYAIGYGLLILYGIAGLAVLLWKRKAIAAYLRRFPMESRCVVWFFLNPGMLLFLFVFIGSMITMLR